MDPTVMAPAVLRVLEAQRPHIRGRERRRAAHRHAIREWGLRHLIPMMRRALRDLAHGNLRSMLAGFTLIASRGPGAVTHMLLRRMVARQA